MLEMGTLVLYGIVPAGDTHITEAKAFALAVLDGSEELDIDTEHLDSAVLDSDKGLVIFDTAYATRSESEGTRVGVHFSTLIAGNKDDTTMMAATILSQFGFGTDETIYAQINHGGDGADIILTKEMNAQSF